MDTLSTLNLFEVRALIKLVSTQSLLQETLDQVYLPGLKDRLQKALEERRGLKGALDMRLGDFDFKIRCKSEYRVQVIKLIREVMHIGLKEAKDISDLGYEPGLPWNEITFVNSTEDLYNRFVQAHDKIGVNPSSDSWMRQSHLDSVKDSIIISALGPLTVSTPAGPDE